MIDSEWWTGKFKATVGQWESQRRHMVKDQLRQRGIKDERVLAAMSKVPRHQFVDSSWRDLAGARSPITHRS